METFLQVVGTSVDRTRMYQRTHIVQWTNYTNTVGKKIPQIGEFIYTNIRY